MTRGWKSRADCNIAGSVYHLPPRRTGVLMWIQTRVIAILTKPADEWRKIAGESATVEGLMRENARPLAAIPPVAKFTGLIRFRLVAGFVYAVVSWVFALGGGWIAAVISEKLAPTFQSKGNTEQALK